MAVFRRSRFTGRKSISDAGAGLKPKMKIRKGDHVMVLSGKDKGRTGKVLRVFPRERRVLVEGINMVKKHSRAGRQILQGGIIDMPLPIHASKVMLLCTKCDTPTRVGIKRLEDGKKVRVCKRCGEVVDKV